MSGPAPLGWLGIARLGLVQTSLGAIVVLATSTLNRVMVLEAALPAVVPGALVGFHYGVQIMRPRLGYGSDLGRRRTPWIVGGMMVLGLGQVVAAIGTALMASDALVGIALAALGFGMVGLGVGAAGTTLLVLLAARVDERRRAAAATIVWMMMIAGFAVTAGTAGHFLEPYSPARLVEIVAGVALIANVVAALAVWGVEGEVDRDVSAPQAAESKPAFRQALAEVWAEPQARRFALFVFASMLAYSAQELILEPFAGAIFEMSPGATTKLSGLQHGGLLVGMLAVAGCGTVFAGRALGAMRLWTFVGCLGSAVCVGGLACAALQGPGWPLAATVFVGGIANGAFAIAAIASMMQLVAKGRSSREGVRMGLWGGAQALAFGAGGFLGASASDLGRILTGSSSLAYAMVFAAQALVFLWAAHLSLRVFDPGRASAGHRPKPVAGQMPPVQVLAQPLRG